MYTEIEQNEIAGIVIGAAMDVHRTVGCGCFETAYAPCLTHGLQRRGLRFETEVSMDLLYEDLVVPRAYRIDFIVEQSVVVEIKALETTGKVHSRQMLTYLRLTGLGLGLLLNFGAPTMAEGIHRVVNNFPYGTTPIGRRSAAG